MQYRIEEVTETNRQAILALAVKDAQKDYIESTAQCLQDALECTCYQPVGLYEEEVLQCMDFLQVKASEGAFGWIGFLLIRHFKARD